MSRRRLVLDASTAILLAKIDLLREVTSRGAVMMAETAVDEALAKDSHDARMIRSLLGDRSIGRLELLAKLQRFGRYDTRILEDVARRIRAAAPSKEGGSPS